MFEKSQAVDLLVASMATQWGFVNENDVESAIEELKRNEKSISEGSLSKKLVESGAIASERMNLLAALAQEIINENGSVDAGLNLMAENADISARFENAMGTIAPHSDSLMDSVEDREPTVKFDLPVPENFVETAETVDTREADANTDRSPTGSIPPESSAPGVRPERFEVQRFLAQGGIGKVSVALDKELNREVAFKEIRQDRNVDRDSMNRFLIEAEVTGRLEHPGIVPIYSLGSSEKGMPYYAMRFIRGKSLTQAIQEFYEDEKKESDPSTRQLRFRKLLQDFVSVCNTLHFAHERGVIHRDIKPDNIMVGGFGETLVVDWGIAKTGVSRQENPKSIDDELSKFDQSLIPELSSKLTTQQGDIMGTPSYMSPEQIVGWQDRIDPRSDVYSLGATLYAVLTGQNPYKENSFAALSQKVLAGDLRTPRAVKPDVPKALEAIAIKAMAPKPSERYASAKNLAEDIESWLADEPVAAFRDPWWARAKRWLKRHPAISSGAIASIALTVIGLIIGLAVVGQFNQKLEVANQNLAQSFARETSQRKRAEDNLQVAQAAVEEYLVQVAEDPTLQTPSFSKIRSTLLTTAIPFYEKFLEQEPGDSVIEESRALAMMKIGGIWGETGENEAAIEQFQSAIKIFQQLLANDPQNVATQMSLSDTYGELARSHETLGNSKSAIENSINAVKTFEQLLESKEVDREVVKRKLAIANGNLGAYYFFGGDIKSAEKYVTLSNSYIEQLEQGESLRYLKSVNLNSLGVLENRKQNYRKAWEYLDACFKIVSKLVAEYPGATKYRAHLGSCLYNVTKAFRGMNDPKSAQANFEAALTHQRWLAGNYPTVPAFRTSLAITLSDYGVTNQDLLNDKKKAEACFVESIAISKKLSEEFPELPLFQVRWIKACHNLSLLYSEQQLYDKSMEQAKQALELAVDLEKRFSDRTVYRIQRASTELSMAVLYQDIGQPAKAIEFLKLAQAPMDSAQNVSSSEMDELRLRIPWGFAESYTALSRFAEAADAYQAAIDATDDVSTKHILQMRKAFAYANKGDLNALQVVVSGLESFEQRNSETYFRIAKTYAVCANALGEPESKPFIDAANRSVSALEEAKRRGHFDSDAGLERFTNETVFDVFESFDKFQEFVDDLN